MPSNISYAQDQNHPFLAPLSSKLTGGLSPCRKLFSERWYHGAIHRSYAEYLLSSGITGSFLVRESESSVGKLTISLRSAERIVHYRIYTDDEHQYYISESCRFATVVDLVKHHEKSTDGLPCLLLYPVSKNDQPSKNMNSGGNNNLDADSCGWEINRTDIVMKHKLGSGQYGVVYEALFKRQDVTVAVKTLKEDITVRDEFLQEADLMKSLRHPNLVRLLGVCTQEPPYYIITEFMCNGNLLDYLRLRPREELPPPVLMFMVIQVCRAMSYLENRNFIHRDLAARNCLVGSSNTVKVADFGLARYMERDLTYRAREGAKFPIKWTAPEGLSYNIFSVKSDVWAFGVLLWEIATYGATPYPGVELQDVCVLLEKGFRMEAPQGCPEPIYQMMLQCWSWDPKDRPMFRELCVQLETLMNSSDINEAVELELQRQRSSMPLPPPPLPEDALKGVASCEILDMNAAGNLGFVESFTSSKSFSLDILPPTMLKRNPSDLGSSKNRLTANCFVAGSRFSETIPHDLLPPIEDSGDAQFPVNDVHPMFQNIGSLGRKKAPRPPTRTTTLRIDDVEVHPIDRGGFNCQPIPTVASSQSSSHSFPSMLSASLGGCRNFPSLQPPMITQPLKSSPSLCKRELNSPVLESASVSVSTGFIAALPSSASSRGQPLLPLRSESTPSSNTPQRQPAVHPLPPENPSFPTHVDLSTVKHLVLSKKSSYIPVSTSVHSSVNNSPLRSLNKVLNSMNCITSVRQPSTNDALPVNNPLLSCAVPVSPNLPAFQSELLSRLKRQLEVFSKPSSDSVSVDVDEPSNFSEKAETVFPLPKLKPFSANSDSHCPTNSSLTAELILASKSRLRQASKLSITEQITKTGDSSVENTSRTTSISRDTDAQPTLHKDFLKRKSWAPSAFSHLSQIDQTESSDDGGLLEETNSALSCADLMSRSATNVTPMLSGDNLLKHIAELCNDLNWSMTHLPNDQSNILADRILEAREFCLGYIDNAECSAHAKFRFRDHCACLQTAADSLRSISKSNATHGIGRRKIFESSFNSVDSIYRELLSFSSIRSPETSSSLPNEFSLSKGIAS